MTEEIKTQPESGVFEKSGCRLKGKKKFILGAMALILFLGYGAYLKKEELGLARIFSKSLSQEEAKTKVEKFIKDNLVAPGTPVEIKGVSEENGLYKIPVSVAGQEIVSYLTKDGKKFFPQGMDIAEIEKQAQSKNQQGSQAGSEAAVKSEVPEVELFVMSYCPYGTQIEKGVLPVLETLGKKIKFSLKFVDYAMHGEKEIKENLRQYCIEKNEPGKLNSYLNCFLKKGEGTENSCLKEAGVNVAKLESCIASADAEFKVTEKFRDKNTWNNGQFPPFDIHKKDNEKYGVKGSPTLVINGSEVSAGRDSASLLKAVCSGFVNPPKECEKELSSVAPSPGFGENAGSSPPSASGAACGS